MARAEKPLFGAAFLFLGIVCGGAHIDISTRRFCASGFGVSTRGSALPSQSMPISAGLTLGAEK